jgi:hypothetical protein
VAQDELPEVSAEELFSEEGPVQEMIEEVEEESDDSA